MVIFKIPDIAKEQWASDALEFRHDYHHAVIQQIIDCKVLKSGQNMIWNEGMNDLSQFSG